MAEYEDREHYIPLRRSDLIDLLLTKTDLPPEQRESFRQFCRLVTAIFHFQYHDQLEELKNEYSPFDPDAVTKAVQVASADAKEKRLDKLFSRFTWLMERANYKRLTQEDLIAATEEASQWGLNMDIDFGVFDRLEVYIRGDSTGTRVRRPWWRFWRMDEVKVPVYLRMALILKQNKHKRLGPNPDVDNVFLKLFKDIPKADIEMMLPGGKLKMPKIARGKLGASLLGAVGFVLYKILLEIRTITAAILTLNPLAFWAPLSLVAGYGYKQYYGFQVAKQTYNFQLTKSLYYQTLDSNAGVLYHLMDEAEEQECREAILGYYYLWRYGGDNGWTAKDIDDYVEMDLERLADLKVDFEIEDALEKIEKLGIVEKTAEDRYRAVPLDRALEMLDYQWDNYFQYNKAPSS